MSATALLLILALAAAPITVLVGYARPDRVALAGVLTSGAAFASALWGWHEAGDPIDHAWIPSWGVRLRFELDGQALLYALLATGIGMAVAIYASVYLPAHQQHEHQPAAEIVRFYGLLLLFMGAMVGLVMSQDLLLLFFFWDLTAVTSYFLIGFDAHRPDARSAAFMALTITGISAIALMIGLLMLWQEYGTTSIQVIVSEPRQSTLLTVAAPLILVGALAKSAQVPLHFWLPRAMAAPTPVSAYLHAAAMVAAGVFLIDRLYPVLAVDEVVRWILFACGLGSIFTGAALALTRTNLKQILAYSTISQYGYVVTMFAVGGSAGVTAASLYVIAHALAKAALFLTAGVVSEATGGRDLRQSGGLWREMPWLAFGSGAAAASLAALPLTLGFFKDELVFHAARQEGWWLALLMVLAAALSFSYLARFWFGIFGGKLRIKVTPPSPLMVGPVVALGFLGIVAGIWTTPAANLAAAAAAASLQQPVELDLAYHVSANAENLMAISAWLFGLVIYRFRRGWSVPLTRLVDTTRRWGPERLYVGSLHGINELSDRLHWIEVRDLRSRITTILVPAAVMIVIALLATGGTAGVSTGEIGGSDLPVVMIIVVACLAAITAAVPRDHFSMALALSAAGFSLAGVYAMLHAPNVALVALLVETIFGLVLFAVMAMLPGGVDPAAVVPSDREGEAKDTHRLRDALVATIGGGIAFAVAWTSLSLQGGSTAVIDRQAELALGAHGSDVVTVILADFRGLDTMGEITVVAIAFTGIATLLSRRVLR